MSKITTTLRPSTKILPPVDTRWGRKIASVEMADGLWHVSGETGRGFWISAERREALPESWRTADRFYSEVAEWSALALQLRPEFSAFFGEEIIAEAERVFADAYAAEAVPTPGKGKGTAR